MGPVHPHHQESHGLAAAVIAKKKGELATFKSLRTFLAVLAAIVIMVAGYFIAGSILYGSIATGATQIPGLAAEGIVGIILFYIIAAALEAAGVMKKLAGDGRL